MMAGAQPFGSNGFLFYDSGAHLRTCTIMVAVDFLPHRHPFAALPSVPLVKIFFRLQILLGKLTIPPPLCVRGLITQRKGKKTNDTSNRSCCGFVTLWEASQRALMILYLYSTQAQHDDGCWPDQNAGVKTKSLPPLRNQKNLRSIS